MKKLLSATLAIAMGATCVGSLAACNSGNDAETAKKAIQSLKVLYDKADLYETATDYEVLGQVNVSENLYNVDWTVSAEANNITDYIKVGDMNTETSLVKISVTKPDEAIEYNLTATVKVGKAKESYDFKRKVPAKPAAHDGTLANPYSVANVVDIASKMTPKQKLEDSDNPVAVHVKGYIVDCGKDQGTSNRVGYVYIVDEYSPEKDSKSPDALMILSINYGTVLTSYADLEKGAEIVVKGYIMNYQKNASSDPQYEVTYYGSNGVTCEAYKKIELTDEQKATAAVKAVKLAATYTAGEVDLPATQGEATLTWEKQTDTSVVSLDGNKMTVSEPDADTNVTLTVTATVNGKTAINNITFTVQKSTTPGTATTPYTVAQVKAELDKLESGQSYQVNGVDKEVYVTGYVTVAGEPNGDYGIKTVYISDTKGDTQANSVYIYDINWNDVFTKDSYDLNVGDKITVKGYLKNYSGTKEIAQTGSKENAIHPEITAIIERAKTENEMKALKALKAVEATLTTVTTVPENNTVDLPTSTVDGVTLNWSTTDTTYTVTDNKLNVTALPTEADATVTLSVTATCDDATTDAKTVTIKIKKASSGSEDPVDPVTLSFASVTDGSGTAITNGDCLTLIEGYVGTDKGLTAATISKGYTGSGTGGSGANVITATSGCIKLGASGGGGYLTLTFDKAVASVKIKCRGWTATDKVSITDGASTDATTLGAAQTPGTAVDTFEFELTTSSDVISIVTDRRAMIFEIIVTFA